MRMRAIRWMGSCQMIPGGGDGSEETITCTIGAYSWPGTIGVRSSVVEGRICLTSAQLPTCGRLNIFLHSLNLFGPWISLLLNGGKCTEITLSQTSHWWWLTKKGQVSPYTFIYLAEAVKCTELQNTSIFNAHGERYELWYEKQLKEK